MPDSMRSRRLVTWAKLPQDRELDAMDRVALGADQEDGVGGERDPVLEELAAGANWFRRLMGAGALGWIGVTLSGSR